MKNLLNLKGLLKSNQSVVNPDGHPTADRRSRLTSVLSCLFLLLTLGTGQMWGTVTIYAVGNMPDNSSTWHNNLSTLYCHNYDGGSGTDWPGTLMSASGKTAAGHTVWQCDIDANNSTIIFNGGSDTWQTSDIAISTTEKTYPQPTCLAGTWYYSINTAGAMWGSEQTVSGGYIYFDNTNAQWSDSKMYLVVGHERYIGYYELTKLAGTNLYYVSLSLDGGWTDAKFVAIAGNSTDKATGDGSPNDLTTLTHYSDVIGYGLNTGTSYMISMSSGTNCTPISIDWQNTGYTAYNSTQTIYKVLGSSTTTTDVGTVSITTTKLTDNCVGEQNNSTSTIGSSSSNTTADAVKTATVTLTASANTGYEFVGWATSASGSTVSTATTFTYTATAATSYYAKFREVTHTVTYTASAGGSVTTPATSSSTVGQVTGVSIEATPSSGYHFDGWSITSGSGTFTGGGTTSASASTTFYPTATATIKATFAADAEETHDVTVYYKCGGSSIGSGSATESAVGVTTARNVTAPSITGYTFSSWALGDGLTNKSANESVNPISIVTKSTGSYTLTANYTLNSHNVTFNANGGTGSMSNESFNYNQTKALTTNTFTRAGYVFKGWATSSANATEGTVAYADGANYTMGDADVTLYAVWWKQVFFVCETSETTIKAHVWYNDGSNHDYKGWESDEAMTNTGSTVNGRTIYSYSFPECYDKVVFRFGSYQTADQTSFTAGQYYYFNGATVSESRAGTWYASVAAIREAWKVFGSWNVEAGAWVSNDFASYGESSATYTVSLDAATIYTFKYVFSGTNAWYGNNDGTMSDGSAKSLSSSEGNLSFTSTVAGTYTFTINYSTSTPTAKVDFPTSYTVNFGVSPAGAADAITTSPSISSGGSIIAGSNITLTHASANSGYTWRGWYSNAAGTGDALGTDDTYTISSIAADKTLYACYTENSYTVTVNVDGGGTVSYNGGTAGASVIASAGVSTRSGTISAIPATGYAFVGWTGVNSKDCTSGCSEHATEVSSEWNSTNKGWDLVVNADENTSITAKFAPRFALLGSVSAAGDPLGGMPGWGDVAYASYADGTYTITRSLTAPNTTYKFQIIDLLNNSWGWRGYTSSENNLAVDNTITYTLNGDKDVYFDSKGVGNYTFTIVEETVEDVIYPKVKIQDGANSHAITWGYVSDNGQEGGTITSVVDGEEMPNTIASGKYVKDGGSITATAAANSGYRFIDFRTSDIFGDGTQLSTANPYKVASVTADQNIYAQFAENLCTVTITTNNTAAGTITVGGEAFSWGNTTDVGQYNYKSLVVAPADGYYFSGWTLSDTPDFRITGTASDESNTTPGLYGLGNTHGSTGTLTANFVELDKIYFRNIFDDGAGNVTRWENVYAYFDYTWDGTKVHTNSNAAYKVTMTRIGTTDVYYGYVPRAITSSSNTKVAFSDTEFTTDYTFYNATASGSKGAARGDYSPLLNMFVPYHTPNQTNDNGIDYYSNGYWMKYDTRASQGAGYYLKVYNSRNNYTQKGEFVANTDDATLLRFTVRLDNVAAEYTRFMITSAGGLNYLAGSTPTSTANSDIDLNEDTHSTSDNDVYFQLTATNEGNYTFYIDQTGDKMKLTVDYPASVGDYRLVYTNTALSGKIRTTDVIKNRDKASTVTTMWIDKNAGGAVLKLQKCTAISDGNPVWTDASESGANTLLTTYTSNFATKGVYKFTVAITDDAANAVATSATCTLSGIGTYTGSYYIKTDCADGGWANYTQNAMEQNTINATAAGFDYYYCKWVGNRTTNVKCVIATDYCNAVSDTLESDAILTRSEVAYQTLPEAASVRFSYSSSTNELKRTYLRGSTLSENFVTLVPNEAGYVYSAATDGTDYHSSNPKFADNGNWTYQMDAWVYPGAKAGVQTSYPGEEPVTNQTLVAPTNDLMGGTEKGSTRYHVRLVYDFKTDHLMSAWMAGAVDKDIDLSSDFMYIRNGQSQADQISVASGKKITTAKKAYGVFQFSKDAMVGNMGLWNTTAYQLCKYYFSFPFDVKVSDIFGAGAFGTDWRIQKYNGAKRAEKGWFVGDGTTTFWEDVTLDSVLHAYEGYLLMLNRVNFNDGSNGVWTNIGAGGSTYLYFPSKDDIGIVTKGSTTVKVPSHECKIDRYFTQDLNPDGTPSAGARNHKYTDSHWNMLGVPLFTDTTGGDFTSTFKTKSEYNASKCGYLYAWDAETNSLSIADTKSFTFNAMYAYMVQYTGDITFNGSVIPTSVAARRAAEKKEYTIDLNLTKEDLLAGHTYVELREDADDLFMLNEDMYMVKDSKMADIYTFAGCYDVSANVLSVENHVVPIGVDVKSADTYTFSMPSNFDGTVTLIDNFTQTRTNLAVEDYEVSLPKGTINDRFELEINIRQVPTAIDGVTDGSGSLKDGKAHKFIENGAMYILREGQIYDARGNKVK